MAHIWEMDDYELAKCFYEWSGDAANRWGDFRPSEKDYLLLLRNEICRRFVNEHLGDSLAVLERGQ